MKKSTLLTIVALVLALAMGVSGTMAYLQDQDADVNVMTLGSVYIEQIEEQLAADGTTKEPYEQNKPFYPGCEISKIVSVKNTGKSDAYFRTLFAFEDVPGSDTFKINFPIPEFSGYTWSWGAPEATVQINGKTFKIYEAVYNDVLKPGDTSPASLTKVVMDVTATNEDMEVLGGNYEILVVSQAVQTAGFTDAKTALNAAFGDITATNHPWLGVAPNDAPTSVIEVGTVAELEAAIASGDKVIIHLKDGVYSTGRISIPTGKEVTISGSSDAVLDLGFMVTGKLNLTGMTIKNDKAFTGEPSKFIYSAVALQSGGEVVCTNVTFEQSLNDGTAITSWWDTGAGTEITVKNCTFNSNGQRPIQANGNVTVENSTFNDPYRYTIQMTGKASTAANVDKVIINYYNNTIVNGNGGKAFVYGIQLEGETYGCGDLVVNGANNTIVAAGTDSAMYYCECGKVAHNTISWNVDKTVFHQDSSAFVGKADDLQGAIDNDNVDTIYAPDSLDGELILENPAGPINFDGKNKTVVLNGKSGGGAYSYLGFVPKSGEDATVKNLKVTGSGFVEVGHYGYSTNGNYIIENLTIKNLSSTLANGDKGNTLGCAFAHYGNATLNNCVMTGTTAANPDASPVDAGFVNDTTTVVNGGEYGRIYCWSHSVVTINGAKVNHIDVAPIKGSLTISAGTQVDTINFNYDSTNVKPEKLIIDPNATVGQIIYQGTTYTQAEWAARP